MSVHLNIVLSAVTIESLRQELRGKFPQAHTMVVQSEKWKEVPIVPVEGSLCEIVCDEVGGNMVLHRLFAQAKDSQIAFVDSKNRFDPESYGQALCDRILWVRVHVEEHAWKATDWLLKDGNMGLVVFDTRGMKELNRVPRSHWYRFRNHCEEQGGAGVVLSSEAVVPCVAQRWSRGGQYSIEDLERSRAELLGRVEKGE